MLDFVAMLSRDETENPPLTSPTEYREMYLYFSGSKPLS